MSGFGVSLPPFFYVRYTGHTTKGPDKRRALNLPNDGRGNREFPSPSGARWSS
jgi:hypothetical protein